MTAGPEGRDYAFLRGISAYEVLGVGRKATDDEIRLAHRRLIVQNHPDHAGTQLFAQLLNDAKRVLQSDRTAYDRWLDRANEPPRAHASSEQAPHGSPNHPPRAPARLMPHYVPADGKPAYFTPPGAVPRSAQRVKSPDDGALVRFSGVLQDLGRQAHRDVLQAYGQPENPRQQLTYERVAQLLAIMRLCRLLYAPTFSDDQIADGLRDPAPFIEHVIAQLARTPPRPERDQGLALLRQLPSTQGAGVVVRMTVLAIETLAGRASQGRH